MNRLLILICLLTAVCSCNLFEPGYREGTFPDTPINLADINSADDDYNSTSNVAGDVIALVFSSKRGGRADFNFIHEALEVAYDLRKGKFMFTTKPYGGLSAIEEQNPLTWATSIANSTANELGPYVRSYDHDIISRNDPSSSSHRGEYLMLFASDRTGNLDIYLTHNYQTQSRSASGVLMSIGDKRFSTPVPVPFLNSSADDAYPTFDATYSSVYFTSNRSGLFAIYKATLPATEVTELQDGLPTITGAPIEKVANLSSSADDKCPFIDGNRLVFTSNRPGGYGGFDLYYSVWDGKQWGLPVNFGPTINSASDEYRPILTRIPQQFSNQLMIFSSNRPGGKGGFDLYMVGVPKLP